MKLFNWRPDTGSAAFKVLVYLWLCNDFLENLLPLPGHFCITSLIQLKANLFIPLTNTMLKMVFQFNSPKVMENA